MYICNQILGRWFGLPKDFRLEVVRAWSIKICGMWSCVVRYSDFGWMYCPLVICIYGPCGSSDLWTLVKAACVTGRGLQFFFLGEAA